MVVACGSAPCLSGGLYGAPSAGARRWTNWAQVVLEGYVRHGASTLGGKPNQRSLRCGANFASAHLSRS
jgi:hypothetical protein